ncbi:MAG: hypothetical protein ABI220_01870 [Candidatus Saccharimonadales bacterium]
MNEALEAKLRSVAESTVKRIFWDWDGVLGLKRFWYKSVRSDKTLKAFVEKLFSDSERTKEWMRGRVSLTKLIEMYKAPYSYDELSKLLISDWSNEAINVSLFSAVRVMYPNVNHYIVTDNMTIFNNFVHQSRFIQDNFERVFNSSDYGSLKDDEISLFDYVLDNLKLESFHGSLLFDDSPASCKRFEQLGGRAIVMERI